MEQKVALDAKALTDLVIEGLQNLKGKEIVRMDLSQTDGAMTDYFVICTGTSDTHVSALADSVLKTVKEQSGDIPISKEGMDVCEWVLIDYVNVIVQIFLKEKREFYRLESLWGDADIERIPDM
ncbi:ribosome silencing factor [Pontibacter sp. G13]|uniref:ribosome silencing factor n=1 Tax=Pontibacter sp. G13 TaxID=3074898 RepID=UPI00288963D9|nr:ribosome silencing factor [Pontibacter sp. G13]WNJ15970.1 ribosome silencing factor [Pontibacter sp. G13]